MTESDYHHALGLLDATLALFTPRGESAAILRRRLRTLSREFMLLRAHLGQPDAWHQRN